jgi:hypothetical protein
MTKLLSTALLLLSICESAVSEPPNGSLEVTYQQLEDGKLSDSYHQITLSCYDGDCSLQTVTFNQCLDLPLASDTKSSQASFIKVESANTKDGSLSVTSSNDSTLTLNHSWKGANITYRFEFKVEPDPFKKALFGTQRDMWFAGVTDFSGAATKSSDFTKEVLSWKLVPLRSSSIIPYVGVKTSCAVSVSAIPKSDKK